MNKKQEAEIRAIIAKENELRQDWHRPTQCSSHRRILLVEVERLRKLLKEKETA